MIIVIIDHERGIPSKRESSARVDYVPALCTHRPSLLPIEWFSESLRLARMWLATVAFDCRELAQTRSFRGSKSRNKVSVGEPAEGSLPISHTLLCVLKTTVNSSFVACGGSSLGLKCTLKCACGHTRLHYRFFNHLLNSSSFSALFCDKVVIVTRETTSNGESLGSCLDDERCQLR